MQTAHKNSKETVFNETHDLAWAKRVVTKCICGAANALDEAPISDEMRIKCKLVLFTGSQIRGVIEGVNTLDTLEYTILSSPALLRRAVYNPGLKDEPNTEVTVLEFALPNMTKAYTDTIHMRELYKAEKMDLLRTEYSTETEEPVFFANCHPIKTDSFHVVLVNREDRDTFIDRWEPGPWVPKSAPIVSLVLGPTKLKRLQDAKLLHLFR